MSAFRSLEARLDDIFVGGAPPLPSNAKKIIVEYLPYINLVLGVLTLMTAWRLYDTARAVNSLVYGSGVSVDHLTGLVWLSIAVLVIEAVLYISAFDPTKHRRKSGWDLLFYALLVNLAYGIVVSFSYYGGVGRLLGSLLGSAIGFYFLFQIRASYKNSRPNTKRR
jgi:hypothetical protein